jgi:hypothetical protein
MQRAADGCGLLGFRELAQARTLVELALTSALLAADKRVQWPRHRPGADRAGPHCQRMKLEVLLTPLAVHRGDLVGVPLAPFAHGLRMAGLHQLSTPFLLFKFGLKSLIGSHFRQRQHHFPDLDFKSLPPGFHERLPRA